MFAKQNHLMDIEFNNSWSSTCNATDVSSCSFKSQNNVFEVRAEHLISALANGKDKNKLIVENNLINKLDFATKVNDNEEIAQPSVEIHQFYTDHHAPDVFYLACNCQQCIEHRVIIIDIFYDDYKFNRIWNTLQTYINDIYDIIPDNNSVITKKYKSLISNGITKWCSDGLLCGSHVSLQDCTISVSNELTLIDTVKSLFIRDPHQMFQLICTQIRAITIAYSEKLKHVFKLNNGVVEYSPTELMNFILDGYDKICKSAKTIEPFLYELQVKHLNQFSLSWCLLNKLMYYRWVYMEVETVIPECILKLKKMVYSEKYKSIVFRFIKFDDAMVLAKETWKDVWTLIHDYESSQIEIDRRRRITVVHKLFQNLKQCSLNWTNLTKDEILNISQLSQLDKLDFNVWKNIFTFIKHFWLIALNEYFSIDIKPMHCTNCKAVLDKHHFGCDCKSCLIEAVTPQTCESKEKFYCSKCSLYYEMDEKYVNYIIRALNSKLEQSDILNEVNDKHDNDEIIKNDKVYHLSWAIFKHLANRVPYDNCILNSKHLCIFQNQPCSNISCKVAAHIVAGMYPLNLSKLLLGLYNPVNNNNNKRTNIVPGHLNSFLNKFVDSIKKTFSEHELKQDYDSTDINLLFKIYSHKEDINSLRHMVSLLAESGLTKFEFSPNENVYPCFLSLFKIKNNELELKLNRLECIYALKMRLLSDNNIKTKWKTQQNYCEDMRSQINKFDISSQSIMSLTDITAISNIPNVLESESKIQIGDVLKTKSACLNKLKNIVSKTGRSNHESWQNKAMSYAVKKKINSNLEAELSSFRKEQTELKHKVIKSTNIKSPNRKTSTSNHDCHLRDCIPEKEAKKNTDESTKDISRICHRSEGQCVCYYCTIFGVLNSEWSRGRTTSTRDRLRKRLNQIQSSKGPLKSVNIKTLKNTSDLLKTKTESKTTNSPKIRKDVENLPTISNIVADKKLENDIAALGEEMHKMNVNKPPVNKAPVNKAPVSNASVDKVPVNNPPANKPPMNKPPVNKPPVSKPAANTTSRTTAPSNVPATPRNVQLDLNSTPHPTGQNSVNSNLRQTPIAKPKCDEEAPSIGLSSVNDLLHFIEGSSETKSKDISKKAAKKARQKQKKDEQSKIRQLEELREEFEKVCVRELELKLILKKFKTSKKKDKKKINEHEVKVRQVDIEKFEMETVIKEIISYIKTISPDFKFSYQPKLNQSSNSSGPNTQTTRTINNCDNKLLHTTIKIPPIPPSIAKEYGVNPIVSDQSFIPLSKSNEPNNQNYQESSADATKRIVTIRRVNLPHAEPQVTVTAKGSSPDKDMLLYTFVNGQLVSTNAPPNETKTKVRNAKSTENVHKGKSIKQATDSTKIDQKTAKLVNDKPITVHKPVSIPLDIISRNQTKKNNAKSESASNNNEKLANKKKESKVNSKTNKDSTKSTGGNANLKIKSTDNSSNDTIVSKNIKEKTETTQPICLQVKREVKKPLQYKLCESIYESNKFQLLADELSECEDYDCIDVATIANVQKSDNVKTYENKKQKCTATSKLSNNLDKKTALIKPNAESKLSKKQKKKQNQADNNNVNPLKVNEKDVTVNSLTKSIERLRVNTDTTIKLVTHRENVKGPMENNISIMDQLKLGVNVEGLKLPPGITLTKVDSSTAESMKLQKESIAKISQPMQTISDQSHAHPMESKMGNSNQNGVIMIDTLNIKRSPGLNSGNCESETKKPRKQRKKSKSGDTTHSTSKKGKQPNEANQREAKIVTLRNPIFQSVNNSFHQNQIPLGEVNSLPKQTMPVDQPAAIIKNENGMFTIRNPALQHAIQSGVVNNLHQYNTNGDNAMSQHQENFSYFSDGTSSHQSSNKCYSAAIGSELKNVQQKKQMHQKQNEALLPPLFDHSVNNGNMYNNYGFHRNQSPSLFENQCVYGLNSNFIIPSTCNSPKDNSLPPNMQTSYFNNLSNGCQSFSLPSNECKSLFCNNRCDEINSNISGTGSKLHSQYYGDGSLSIDPQHKYDDLSFLQNLQPGHRLNSEVTIHNISESKFSRNKIHTSNGIEITKIHGSPPTMSLPNPNSAGVSNRNGTTDIY